jgi:glutathione synthase
MTDKKGAIRLGVVMDPIHAIQYKKDTTLEMLLQAQARGWELHYIEQNDLFVRDGQAWASHRPLEVYRDADNWFSFKEDGDGYPPELLSDLDVILMRKDPPFDMEYVYTTYILELAQKGGALIVNRPSALRDCNEKMFTSWFPDCTPPTLVSRNYADLRSFLKEQDDIIVKPLDGMGGASIFRLRTSDPNTGVILETITRHETRFVMAQRFIPEIVDGDKRILLIDGDPVPYALARIPAPGETRGNLAVGGRGVGVALSDSDLQICHRVAPELRDRGILFAGLDVIGSFLTEVNVTSPTCVRELNDQFDLDIAGDLMKAIELKLDGP